MKSEASIRINIAIHPEKDPALFDFLNSINKEARSRRLLNLAFTGLLSERTNAGLSANALTTSQHVQSIHSANHEDLINTNHANTKLMSNINDAKPIDEEEMNALEVFFG